MHPNIQSKQYSKLFTIAKIQKQPKCPSTDEWIKMWHAQKILQLNNNMDRPGGYYTSWNNWTVKDEYCMFYFIYGI